MNDDLHEIKDKEIIALRSYIDSLHAAIDSLTAIAASKEQEEEMQYEDDGEEIAYKRKKR